MLVKEAPEYCYVSSALTNNQNLETTMFFLHTKQLAGYLKLLLMASA